MNYTCGCGRTHTYTGKTIVCSGPGHHVMIRPEWFKYRQEIDKPKTVKDQYALF